MKTSDGVKKFLGGQKFQICEEGGGSKFLDVFRVSKDFPIQKMGLQSFSRF
jgi:hypothetical protein